jgi:multiple sugar transport system substrate-binding protein
MTQHRRHRGLGAAGAITLATAAVLGQGAGTAAQDADGFDPMAHSGETITFLANQHPWTAGMTPLLEQFTAETGINVDVQEFSEDLYFDRMEQTVRAAEGTADVYFLPMDSTAYTQFTADAVEPLTPYLEDPTKTSPDYDFADFPAGFLGGVTYPPGDPAAQVYGIPIAFEAYILFYNKDLVDQYLDGAVPTTFDELIAAAQEVSAEGAADGVVGAVMRGIRSDTIMDTLSGIVLNAFGGRDAPTPYNIWFDGDWSKPRLTDPDVCQGLADFASLLATGPANKFAIDWPDANALFQQGKAAFFIDASLFGPGYEDPEQSVIPGRVGYMALPPRAADGNSYTGHWLWGLGIPKNAANKDAAWYFIQWMTNKANTAAIGAATGGAPRLSAYADPTYTDSLVPEYVAAVNDAMSDSRTTVVLREGWREGALAIVDGMLAIANGEDPTTACAAANEALAAAVA